MISRKHRWRFVKLALLVGCNTVVVAQEQAAPARTAEVTARLAPPRQEHEGKAAKIPPAVVWLNPLRPETLPPLAPGNFTLVQKNKMFSPHLLVVPVGSNVAFPNEDTFFHNVFSLFDGRRFDLGLYEAGSSRSVVFPREGVSYIFCNIHSEMSAVVIALATPLYGFADSDGVFHVKNVPDGDYDLHVWIEGQKQNSLDLLTQRVHVAGDSTDFGEIHSDHPEQAQHLNKFGRPYEPEAHPIY